MTISQLEALAGVTDRAAFWARFSHIRGTVIVHHKERSKGLEAGIAELIRMAAERGAA